ncbi:hypothetical protein MTBPR1_20089 [Candidatus Terasakiella magnetica]|uniref:Uncharacterized protein n=1 Tax=Candidatus Terasakiella magnetica TaxID=1867952 RepID=A0A1C3RG65_9PROT|nr:hypothetical protein [Candidatus Terasakiella magnetica]SCA56241.1 hypothetical protein MTBPR1_20089 [Candidatus Terasakiella magnetica]
MHSFIASNNGQKLVRLLDVMGLKEPLRRAYYKILARKEKVLPSKEIISISPHNIKLYEYFIRFHISKGAKFITSADLYPRFDKKNDEYYIHLRHDIDYAPESLHLFLDIEKKYNIRSDIYLILSNDYYDVDPYVKAFQSYAKEGFVFGLHTLAPAYEDFYSVLRDELDIFQLKMGFSAKYFTIHGPSAYPERPEDWPVRRQKFLDKVSQRLPSFGFEGSSNYSLDFSWVEDAGQGGFFSYLTEDWITESLPMGHVHAVLTHPCHWVDWPIKWKIHHSTYNEADKLKSFIESARDMNTLPSMKDIEK